MKAIKCDAIISSVRSKTDHSLSLTVHTPELTTTERAAFMDLQGYNCEMVIAPQDEPNVPEIKIDKELESKTPSARLRAVIFLAWREQGEPGEFNDYYRREMEKMIDFWKEKLN